MGNNNLGHARSSFHDSKKLGSPPWFDCRRKFCILPLQKRFIWSYIEMASNFVLHLYVSSLLQTVYFRKTTLVGLPEKILHFTIAEPLQIVICECFQPMLINAC